MQKVSFAFTIPVFIIIITLILLFPVDFVDCRLPLIFFTFFHRLNHSFKMLYQRFVFYLSVPTFECLLSCEKYTVIESIVYLTFSGGIVTLQLYFKCFILNLDVFVNNFNWRKVKMEHGKS